MSISNRKNSVSKPGSQEILNISHFFSCQNRMFLLSSLDNEPLPEFAKLDHSGKIILIFSSHDFDSNINFEGAEVAVVCVRGWIHFSLLLKRVEFPIDYLILDRVDSWDGNKPKNKVGRHRKPILASLDEETLKGTNVIITSMGYDVGLSGCVDEHILI